MVGSTIINIIGEACQAQRPKAIAMGAFFSIYRFVVLIIFSLSGPDTCSEIGSYIAHKLCFEYHTVQPATGFLCSLLLFLDSFFYLHQI